MAAFLTMRDSGSSSGGGGSVAVRTGLVGLAVVGTAACCYCVYRAASRRRGSEGGAPKAPLLQKVAAMPVISCRARKGSESLGQEDVDLPKSSHELEAHHMQKLIHLLDSTKDPTIQEQALITLSNSAAFSANQDIIRNLGGLIVVGKMLLVPDTKVKEKALNALNNLSMNIKNQEEMKIYISTVCEETGSSPLNSELQLSGLRFLTNMSVTNDYHYMMTSSIPCFFNMLLEGDERTQVQVLKVLVNLSANPAMTEHLLNAQAPFLLSLFDTCTNKEVLLRVLVFATNLTKHMQKDKSITAHHHREGSVFSVLWGNTTEYPQKLTSLLYHHDTEVKEYVAELIMQRC